MGTQILSKKHTLMDRLRHVRSSALATSTTRKFESTISSSSSNNHNSAKTQPQPQPQPPPDNNPITTTTSQRGQPPDDRRATARKPSSAAKARRPVHREDSLDMDELDTRLEQFALVSSSSSPRHPRRAPARDQAGGACLMTGHEPEGGEAEGQVVVPSTMTTKTTTAAAPAPARKPTTTRPAAAHGAGSRMHPSDPAEALHTAPPTDFQMFLREAEEEDDHRHRGGSGPGLRRGHERLTAPNPFYSGNWTARSEPPEKLSGIEESGDSSDGEGARDDEDDDVGDDDDGDDGRRGRGHGGAATATAAAAAAAAAAAPARIMPPLPRAHTDPCGVQGSRHIHFSSGTSEAGARNGGRRGSGASCSHRMKSPPRPMRRQRSMMKVISDYIRLPRE